MSIRYCMLPSSGPASLDRWLAFGLNWHQLTEQASVRVASSNEIEATRARLSSPTFPGRISSAVVGPRVPQLFMPDLLRTCGEASSSSTAIPHISAAHLARRLCRGRYTKLLHLQIVNAARKKRRRKHFWTKKGLRQPRLRFWLMSASPTHSQTQVIKMPAANNGVDSYAYDVSVGDGRGGGGEVRSQLRTSKDS